MRKTPFRWSPPRVFALVLLAGMSGAFAFLQAAKAARTPLIGDERLDLFVSARKSSVGDILLHGPALQPNPAPLNILFLKVLDLAAEPLGFLGLPPMAYLRLPGIAGGLAGAAGLLAFIPLLGRAKSRAAHAWELLLFSGAAAAFLFSFHTVRFSTELRAYALWNGLWFLCLAWAVPLKPFATRLVWPSVLLSLTASPALFQAAALAAGTFLTRARRSWRSLARRWVSGGWWIPVLASVYVLALVRDWSAYFPPAQTRHFLSAWLDTPSVWLLSLLGIAFCFARPRTQRYAGPLIACLLLFLAGPFFFLMIKLSHYQVTHRYFSYYALALPVHLLVMLACARQWRREGVRWRAAFAALSAGPLLWTAPGLSRQALALAREARSGEALEIVQAREDFRRGEAPVLQTR